ncbi:MAG: hypothetical protein KME45_24705 [Stenomitos rutilans HA7619-LM2]|jgi:hypothetical protein|nr:hypothetical protein [Stenomitos rutilans HA7619-LM2]
MRQQLPASPKRPLTESGHLGRKLLKLLQRLLIHLFKILRWVTPVVIGLLAIWVIGGNLLAAQQEKRVDQAVEQYIQQFPTTETNNSALKLEELSTGLGFGKILGTKVTPTRYLHLPTPKADQKSFVETLGKDLSRYLDSQFKQPNDKIDAPPENIHQYLVEHAIELEAVRTHILSSELPRWEMSYIRAVGDIGIALPSFLSVANLQKILVVDILDKTRQGQLQAALETLEVSWKLNQALQEQPTLIAQLVVIINSSWQASVMRKMQELPTAWQERLNRFNKYDLPQSFLKGLYSEAFLFVSARKYPALSFFKSLPVFELSDSSSNPYPQWFISLSDLVFKPYLRLAAVDYFDRMRQLVLKLPEQDFCAFDPDTFSKQPGIASAWWNPYLGPAWVNQWHKVGKAALRFELTQKVLQVKEAARRQSSLPKQIPGIESSICRDAQWLYQLAPDGTASISFGKELDWMKFRNDPHSPLQYAPGDRLQYSFKPKQSNPTPVP